MDKERSMRMRMRTKGLLSISEKGAAHVIMREAEK